MAGRGQAAYATHAVVYCIVPRELASKLHEPLRRYFRDERIEVVVESRARDRRAAPDRRDIAADPAPPTERRRIRSRSGRRVAERRATILPVDAPALLPRVARSQADRLQFIERLEPTALEAEDRDTARLVMRIQAGEQDALADLYMRYFDRVYSYLRTLLGDAHTAEDTTQDVFASLLETLPMYERREQPFRAWLFVIVRNRAMSRMRHPSRREVLHGYEPEPAQAEPVIEGELNALDWISDRELILFVERLPIAQRQVLLLRYLLDLTHVQIAGVLGRSEDDVRMLHSRALRFLRKRLTALGRDSRHGTRSRALRPIREARVLRNRRFALLR